MAKHWPPRQWDVWWASLRDGVQGEQTGDHHVLVVSSNLVHSQMGVTVVAPLTTRGSEHPSVVPIDAADAGLQQLSFIECHQLQALAPKRFIEFRKRIPEGKRAEVALAVAHVLRGLFPQFDEL